MLTPPPYARPSLEPPKSAIVQMVGPADVQWNRRIFKAPPLEVQPPLADVAAWLVSQRTAPFDLGD